MDSSLISLDRKRAALRPAPPANHAAGGLDARQSLALGEWRRLSRQASPPLRSALRPDRIIKALPVSTLMIVDWSAGHITLTHRIEGGMVQLAFGARRTGRGGDRFRLDHLCTLLPALNEAVTEGSVTLTGVHARTAGGAKFDYSRLLLPFADESGRVVRLLAVYGFDTDRLQNMRRPLRWTNEFSAEGTARSGRDYMRLKTA
jgi:hypothetical protein